MKRALTLVTLWFSAMAVCAQMTGTMGTVNPNSKVAANFTSPIHTNIQTNYNVSDNGSPCPGAPTVTDIDGNTYNTVMIGQQCWMKENLRVTRYSDGTYLATGSSYSNEAMYYTTPGDASVYGLLYNLRAATRGWMSNSNPSMIQGICPIGWHVPSYYEVLQMKNYLINEGDYGCGGNSSYIAKALASTVGWSNTDTLSVCAVANNPAANNLSGFSFVPHGYFFNEFGGGFGSTGYSWTTSPGYYTYTGLYYDLYSGSEDFIPGGTWANGYGGLAVRCIKGNTVATVTTNAVSNVASTTATCGGNVLSDGGETVTARGVCWGTTESPSLSDSYTIDNSGTGMFTSSLTGLTQGTTYYVRAYATNSLGTAYGEVMTFTTEISCPTPENITADAVSNSSAHLAWTGEGDSYTLRYRTAGDTVPYFFDDFENGISNWTVVRNGEGNEYTDWRVFNGNFNGNQIEPHSGSYMAESRSWDSQAYNVDNWLITPAVTLDGTLSFWVRDDGYYHEHYDVYVSTGSNSISDFSLLYSPGNASSEWTEVSVDLSGYQGVTGYLAIRLVDYDQDYLLIDDFGVYETAIPAGEWQPTITTASNSANITGLSPNTEYEVQVQADCGSDGLSVWSALTSFTTGSLPTGDALPCPGHETVTDYDGNVYNTVKISNLCWTKESLRTTHYADGTSIPTGGSNVSNTDPYYYDDSSSSIPLAARGYLYNWPAAMHGANSSTATPSSVQGVCPNGWHLPSDAEWTQLTNYVESQSVYQCGDSSDNIAKALASTEEWKNSGNDCAVGNNQTANNTTGFSAVPASYCNGSTFFGVRYAAYFWSSSEYVAGYAWFRYMRYNYADVTRTYGNKSYGCSVRCVLGAGANPPAVTTDTVNNVGSTSATCGGNVTSDGGATVTARGVCWSTSQSPTINDSHTTDGSGTGSFTSSLTGLQSNTTYYVRTYATNSMGTAYGNVVSFTTGSAQIVPSSVSINGESDHCEGDYFMLTATADVPGTYTWSNGMTGDTIMFSLDTPGSYTYTVTVTSATGNTLASDPFTVTVYHNPVLYDLYIVDADGAIYDSTLCLGEIINIFPVTDGGNYQFDYYVDGAQVFSPYSIALYGTGYNGFHVFALNGPCVSEMGTSIEVVNCIPDGDAQPCPGNPTVTDYDGNVYNTVKIGNQCWMKENLRVTHYADGVDIPSGSTPSYETSYRYSPNGDDNNAASYGYLYNWAAVMHGAGSNNDNPGQVQGVCPTGWHLPSSSEWDQLTGYVGSIPAYQCSSNSSYIVKALASNEGWNYSSVTCRVGNDLSSNNATGFSAMPAAYYGSDGSVGAYFHRDASFWSSTQTASSNSRTFRIYSPYEYPYYDINLDQKHGLSVRCILGDGANLPAVGIYGDTIEPNFIYVVSNVTYDGNAEVTARGVCWNTTGTPTLADAHTSDGTGTGEFTSIITGLEPNTTYYVRAYATNSVGTAYSEEVVFTTTDPACQITFEMHDSFGDGWNGNKIRVYNNGYAQEVTLTSGSYGVVSVPVYNGSLDLEWVDGSYKGECSVTITGPCLYYACSQGGAPSGTFFNSNIDCTGDAPAIPSFTYWTENTCNSVIVHFESTSTNADDITWEIGGYPIYSEWTPTYEINSSGNLPVTLSVSNSSCTEVHSLTQYLSVTVPDPIITSFDTVVCSVDLPITWKGHTFTGAETYTATLQAANGCDSTVTLILNTTDSPTLTHTPDTIVHAGTPIILWASGANNLLWTNTYDDTLGIGGTITATPTETTTYYVTGSTASSNLVVNGDFEQGNTGFTSAYSYVNDGSYGHYYVAHENHEMWSWDTGDTIFDHTTGNGQWMMVDAYYGRNIWTQTVEVSPNTNYEFSAWFVTNNIANVRFEINDLQGDIFTTPQQRAVWERRQILWNSGTATTATLKITSGYATSGGNDFGIDDIVFTPIVCETTEAITVTTPPPGDALPCPGHETVTDYDGNVYNTVKIGEQCWMKENLRVTHYEDGVEIPTSVAVPTSNENLSNTIAYRYSPNGNDANIADYGLLYNWAAVMHGSTSSNANPSNVQGVCPTGWHVPSSAEYDQLTDYMGSIPIYTCNNGVSKALASNAGWHNYYSNSCAPGYDLSTNNYTGFNAMPAGGNGGFGDGFYCWSATQSSGTNAIGRDISYNSRYISTVVRSYGDTRTVRCVLGDGCLSSVTEFSDTICTGSSYSWNNSVYTESGDYTQTFTNAAGCDSVVTLHLTITDCAPSCDAFAVRILGDTTGCATDSVTLYAMVPGATPPVAVGDILCTDNTIVKPGDWPLAGKTALGVVFHVDGTGLHGWAVHLNDQSTSIIWGGYGTDIPTLPNYSSPREALADTAGHANTAAIRAYGDAAAYPAAWAVDLDNGWYLPAAGQLRTLYGELPTLNASLQIVGGAQFPMSGYYWYYWSSTEYNSGVAWGLECIGYLYHSNKTFNDRVRSVRAF